MRNLIKISLLTSLGVLLSACGGSIDNNDDNESQKAQLTFAVSDSPENVQAVVIAFKNVAVKRVDSDDDLAAEIIAMQDEEGEETDYRQIDLIEFQGADAAELFSGIELDPGDYQMCIYITDGNGSQDLDDSYVIEEDDSVKGLQARSNGACAGYKPDDEETTGRLKTTTFTLNEGNNYLVAEFNLLQVLKEPAGNNDYWTLKPTGYELVHNDQAGTIKGTVTSNVIANCVDDDVSMAYLYPPTSVEYMGDFRADIIPQEYYMDKQLNAPLASTKVNQRIDGSDVFYEYEFGFVLAGDYSIAYTCTSDNPETAQPESYNLDEAPSIIYQNAPAVNVKVIAEETVNASAITEG